MSTVLPASPPCDVIVVDDGSEPPLNTGRYDVTLIRFDENEGIVSALNAGLNFALKRGYEYVARMDAGDFVLPDRLAKQAAYLDEHPACMLVGSDAEVRSENGSYRFTIEPPRDPKALSAALRERVWLLHSTVMFRSSIFKEVGLYSNEFDAAEDYELFMRIAARHEIGVVPEPLVVCIFGGRGISRRKSLAQAINRLRIQARYFDWKCASSYHGILRTAGSLLLPRCLKSIIKDRYLYTHVCPGMQAVTGGDCVGLTGIPEASERAK